MLAANFLTVGLVHRRYITTDIIVKLWGASGRGECDAYRRKLSHSETMAGADAGAYRRWQFDEIALRVT